MALISGLDRRFRIYFLDESIMQRILLLCASSDQVLERCAVLPDLRDLFPEGFQIRGIHFDYPRHAFGVLVYHHSFELVEEGCSPPEIALMGWRQPCLGLPKTAKERAKLAALPDLLLEVAKIRSGTERPCFTADYALAKWEQATGDRIGGS